MQYRIVCTNQEPFGVNHDHAHIVAVGTGTDPSRAAQRWPLEQVLIAMGNGHTFYTQGASSGRVAAVMPFRCTPCGRTFIRSAPDAVYDNNLDNLRVCVWEVAPTR